MLVFGHHPRESYCMHLYFDIVVFTTSLLTFWMILYRTVVRVMAIHKGCQLFCHVFCFMYAVIDEENVT